MKLTLLIVMSFLSLNCSEKHQRNEVVFYVIKHPKKEVADTSFVPKPPPVLATYYGNINFILLDTAIIYYHRLFDNRDYYWCGTGRDFTKPPILSLTPDSLTEINITDLQSFLIKSIPDSTTRSRHYFASISYPSDTIRNRGFKIITDYFKSQNIRRYNIRNWTEEEQYVTTAKIANKTYYPDSIEWKVGFDDREKNSR